jgi:hypothetical protein
MPPLFDCGASLLDCEHAKAAQAANTNAARANTASA